MSGSIATPSMSSMAASINCIMRPENFLFLVQVSCVFVVVCFACANLTTETGNQQTWSLILTSSLGFIMPSPRIKVTPIDQRDVNKTAE